VVDMGSTTTDIAILEGGQPWKNPAGATVGGWQTSVQAVDLRTIGIGGDSHIRVERGQELRVGPRRAIPLCRLGVKWPNIVSELEGTIHAGASHLGAEPADFLTIASWTQQQRLTKAEEALLAALAHGPVSIAHLRRSLKRRDIPVDRLEALGVLRRAGLTPTDLLLVASGSTEMPGSLGMTVNVDAARAGAQVIARQLDLTVNELIHRVIEYVVDRVTREILDKLVTDETGHGLFPAPHGWEFVLELMLRREEKDTMTCHIQLGKPIVAIGAPVAGFIPQVADKLHTHCLIPTHAEVGNAVGAVVSSITHTVEILVQPNLIGAGTVAYLVHSPRGREIYNQYPEAVARAEEIAVSVAQETVRRAGADAVSFKVDRQEMALGKLSEMTVRVTASGRPRMGE